MANKTQQKEQQAQETDIPAEVPAQRAQLVPTGSMDVDPATGAAIRVGYPETSDEDEVGAFLVWLQEKADETNEDSMSRLADMLRTTSTAQSVAEALKEKYTVNGKDFVGEPFLATGFAIHEGKFEDEEIPYFASIEAITRAHPEGFIVNCGGDRVLVHMRNLDRLNAFPLHLRITSKETRKKRTILSLEVLD